MLKAKAKTSAKILLSEKQEIQKKVLSVLKQVSDLVGSTLGPGGKIVLIENDYSELNHIFTKDGVTVLKSIGYKNSIDHVLVESLREAALKTASLAGDGTTTTTILSYELTKAIFEASNNYQKISPQKIARSTIKAVNKYVVPFIDSKAIKISEENLSVLKNVVLTSANGEEELADAVMEVLQKLNFSPASHVTIKQQTGNRGYAVGLLEGYSISTGLEEVLGRFFHLFFTDTSLQKGIYTNPKFLLYDGTISDLSQIQAITESVSHLYNDGNAEYKNLVIVANGFSEQVVNALAYNISDPNTINVIPIKTPMAPVMNSQTHLLYDMAYYLNTKVYGIKEHLSHEEVKHLGSAESIEVGRFKTTIIGAPDATNIEIRAEELLNQLKSTEHPAEKWWLEERLGKLTGGIGVITIYGGNSGELKEMHDRCEDAVLAAKSALKDGAVLGGGRIWLDTLAFLGSLSVDDSLDVDMKIALEILSSAIIAPFMQLFSNAGFAQDEILEIMSELAKDPELLYDLNKLKIVPIFQANVYDSATAVKEAIANAASIASIFGTMSGVVVYPRDNEIDKEEAKKEAHLKSLVDNHEAYANINDHRV